MLEITRERVVANQMDRDFDINYTRDERGSLKVSLFVRTEIVINNKTYQTTSEMQVDPEEFWMKLEFFMQEHHSVAKAAQA